MNIDKIKEEFFHCELSNGLKVYINKHEEFSEYYANYMVKFGSNQLKYNYNNQEKKANFGVAHFLEHVMFAMENGEDYFDYFSKYNANSNAYTSYNQTSYLFSANSNFKESLKLLLKQVQTITISEESVNKEKKIIEEEIQMYLQRPDYKLQRKIYESVCTTNYKIDIAGTTDSIQNITVDELQELFETFYHPSNCVLFISGPIDNEDELIKFIEENQIINSSANDFEIESNQENLKVQVKNDHIFEENITQNQNVFVIKFLPEEDEKMKIKKEIALDIFEDYIASELNEQYIEGLNSKTINSSLQASNYLDNGISLFTLKHRGDIEIDLEEFWESSINNLTEEYISVLIKKKIAVELRYLDKPSNIVEMMLNLLSRNIEIKDYYDEIFNIKASDVLGIIKEMKKHNISTKIIMSAK